LAFASKKDSGQNMGFRPLSLRLMRFDQHARLWRFAPGHATACPYAKLRGVTLNKRKDETLPDGDLSRL